MSFIKRKYVPLTMPFRQDNKGRVSKTYIHIGVLQSDLMSSSDICRLERLQAISPPSNLLHQIQRSLLADLSCQQVVQLR